MVFKDYYKILGLDSNKVTEDEIKTAYREQAKKYHLPTEEQYKELIEFCSWDPQRRNNNFSHYMVIGRNGNYIKLPISGYMIVDRYEHWQNGYFWLNNEDNDNLNKDAALFWESSKIITNLFSGYGLPVLQVK